MHWFLLRYTVNSSEVKPIKYKICVLIPSHIYCNQFNVLSRLVIKFIMRCVVTEVHNKLFIDKTGGILCNFLVFTSSLLAFSIISI